MDKPMTPAELARLMKRMERTKLEDLFAAQVQAHGLPAPLREVRFHPSRDWRFDFAWPDHRLAVEVEGGEYVRGRHQRVGGFQRDTQKYNEAVMLGWRVLRFPGSRVKSGEAVNTVAQVLADEEM